jgi:DNA polymerase zeta
MFLIFRLLGNMEKTLEELLHTKREKNTKQNGSVGGGKAHPPRRRKHIHSLEVVHRKSLYGMYVDPHVFIKATLRDPKDCTRLASILEVVNFFDKKIKLIFLQDAPLGGITMQTYESHIPYLLQFTSDFNVRPMGWMHLTKDVKVHVVPLIGNYSDNHF